MIPYPRPDAEPSALDLALRALARTVSEPMWNAEIQRRVVLIMVAKGETFHSLATRAGRAHSWLAKKLGAAPTSAFTLADLAAVLELLDVEPALLLDPPSIDGAPGAKGRPAVAPEKAPKEAPARADYVDEVIEPYRHLLGTMSDRALAEHIGCAKGRVFRARVRYDIPGTITRKSDNPTD